MAHRRTDPAQSCNFVARDNCWKRYIESELEAARRWSHKWGFLKTPLEASKLATLKTLVLWASPSTLDSCGLSRKPPLHSRSADGKPIEDEKKENTKPKIQLPEHMQVRPVTPVEKYIKLDELQINLMLTRILKQKEGGTKKFLVQNQLGESISSST